MIGNDLLRRYWRIPVVACWPPLSSALLSTYAGFATSRTVAVAVTDPTAALFLHRIPPGGNRFDVFRIRADGSGPTNLTARQPGNNEYPSP